MTLNERLDLSQNGLLCHDAIISRVITRTSMEFAGDYTKLRAITRALIPPGMADEIDIDVEKLSADMAAHVERTSARQFSLAATGGSNPDFYRNWANNGQNKRITAKVFMGIVNALGRNPFDYVVGAEPRVDLPSASVLMSTFAVLLESLGIDPIEGGRAQRLASSFPNALQRSLALQAQLRDDEGSPPEAGAPDPDEDRPAA